jgi:hypothetical protein
MIGIIGLSTDIFLAWLGTVLFPWKRRARSGSSRFKWIGKLLPQPPISASEPTEPVGEKPAAQLNVAR